MYSAPSALAPRPIPSIKLTLPALHAQQKLFVDDPHRVVVAACGTKALDVNEVVATPTGWKTMGDIVVGDQVFNEDGKPVDVDYVSPVYTNTNCYRVSFSDGNSLVADGGHKWAVLHYRGMNREDRDAKVKPVFIYTTEELIAEGINRGKDQYRWQIPTCGNVEFASTSTLPIDPYLLGLWLGDGASAGYTYSSADPELLQAWRAGGWRLTHTGQYDYHIGKSTDTPGKVNTFARTLTALGVKDDKHVPECYLEAPAADRIALIQGLMDTDGFCSKKSATSGTSAIFYNTNKELATQFYDIAVSLGCRVSWREKAAAIGDVDYGICYALTVKAPFQLFRLPRKAVRYTPKPVHRSIVSIEPVASRPVRCIRVNSPTHLFLAGRAFIPTCNTGKTMGLSIWALRHAWCHYQTLTWWCAPTLRQARTAFSLISLLVPEERARINRNEMTISLRRLDGREHSLIEFRSADSPSSLRGEGVHAAVVDEAGYWGRASYESVWTTLTRTRGLLRVISTPKGRNWFWEEWCKGSNEFPALRAKFPEYASYKLPTSANPFVPKESIEEAQRSMPEDSFRQEFLAEFLDESAGVFRNITNCQTGQLYSRPLSGHRYAIGIDWAKHHDYTVLCVGDLATRSVVHIQRYNDIDWAANINRARTLANAWNNAMVLMDSTGLGDVPFDELSSVYGNTYGYSISTNAAKTALIQKLQFALEQNEISIPKPSQQNSKFDKEMAQVLDDELRMYGYEMSAQGKFIFSAPSGYHDDCVIALALLNWQFSSEPSIYRARQLSGI